MWGKQGETDVAKRERRVLGLGWKLTDKDGQVLALVGCLVPIVCGLKLQTCCLSCHLHSSTKKGVKCQIRRGAKGWLV